jgi:acyl carrier protein
MTQQEALQWIADIFEVSVNTINVETQRNEIPAWDSLGVLTLMAGFDEKFGFLLTEEEVLGLAKVEDIIIVLKDRGCLS